MADPEEPIDDDEANEILSSIRKLVSQESGGDPGPIAPPLGAAIGPPAPGRQQTLEAAAPPSPKPAPAPTAGPAPRAPVTATKPDFPPDPPIAKPAAPAQPAALPSQVAVAEDEEIVPLVDEQELRALVAEIVREELQGEMGERITRNIRNLIRKEVARALDEGL